MGSAKLKVDNAGDGTDEGGLVEGRDDDDGDDSLMVNGHPNPPSSSPRGIDSICTVSRAGPDQTHTS